MLRRAGRLLALDPPLELVEDGPDWLRQWADKHKLNLGPEVNLPQWDGKTPDYDCAVGLLLEVGKQPQTHADGARNGILAYDP